MKKESSLKTMKKGKNDVLERNNKERGAAVWNIHFTLRNGNGKNLI
jgi:hypothetical protein